MLRILEAHKDPSKEVCTGKTIKIITLLVRYKVNNSFAIFYCNESKTFHILSRDLFFFVFCLILFFFC